MRREEGSSAQTHKGGSIAGTTKREQWGENERRLESERQEHDSVLVNPLRHSRAGGGAASGEQQQATRIECMLSETER
jgi:hypothetical protein